MKQAEQLAQLSTTEATQGAKAAAIAKDQIWGGEGYTKYTFDDNSVLIQSGPLSYGMDADSRESIEGYREWLGDDADLEAGEISRLLDALIEYAAYVGEIPNPWYGPTEEAAIEAAIREIAEQGGIGPDPHQWPDEQAVRDVTGVMKS
jgi:hypothetical protein